jgi:hypothetical protein
MSSTKGSGKFGTTVTVYVTGPNSGDIPMYAIQETAGKTVVGLEVSPGIYIFSGGYYSAFTA